MRKSLTVLALVAALAAAAALAVTARSAEPQPPATRPAVEVVFVLDTTGSMSGLIQAAKEKIWAIANTLASVKPAPDIKMGLVAYRDRGDAYIIKPTDLSDDLDAVYKELMDFKAAGGGDGPESVNQALQEAVAKIKWSTDDKTYRVIFLVGDYPPHMDYADDVKYPETCRLAAERAIIINTIQCGNEASTIPIWQDIAGKAEGRYFRVEQSGGAILTATPFDSRLAELSKALEATRIWYGKAEERKEMEKREVVAAEIHAAAPASAKAARGAFMAGEAGERSFTGGKELVLDAAEGRVKVAELKDDALPENLQKMPAAEREKFIKEKQEERARLQQQIQQLAAQRQKHIEEQLRKSAAEGKLSLDQVIFDCIRDQAARKGLKYTGGPQL